MLRALPVREPQQLVLLDWNGRFIGGGNGPEHLIPHLFFRDLRKENDVFEDLFARHATEVQFMMKRVATPSWDALRDRRTRWLNVFGRLKPGVSSEQAKMRLQPWFKAYLQADTQREGWPQTTPVQMQEYMASTLDLLPGAAGYSFTRRMMRQPMLVLLAATVLILLLACLNVANLSMAKAFAAQRATALRAALGASRGRILREQLVESTLLAAAGCLVGILLAPIVSRVVLSFLPQQNEASLALKSDLDLRILLFAITITGIATLLSGAAPALFAASIQPMNALKQQSNAVAGGCRKRIFQGCFNNKR